MKIAIINGPNLNLLGQRQPEVYGNEGFEGYFNFLQKAYSNVELEYFQSNIEGELVDAVQNFAKSCARIVLNAAAYTHTSIALADAVAAVKVSVIEVHISNVHAREAFRHHSYISPYAAGVIAGFGLDGYRLAIEGLLKKN
ncbi:3-dehydroquinate dehydratase, type II [Owenweeksia hongkongensis DSM 17368]|uniref:3-dehydroquinate dehydratase n=1 Tax=Owenweeksia hongkongensis (strain DSM 17368 / CIP 108786 / JCM 12287 / NRRL B-23963 / UST20020801) TaxID=926562 RepID=G8R4L5_OWEHD|nr:type II 3-dehydroquinate dehydratase [Owenweeksia hongkongensis]AEV32104.1 3-dehydroquinate dehydratase, type II [Owenweeksia hongkongensis DSM 17368]